MLGSFCVVDTRPRTWTERDDHVLDVLARAASSEVALVLQESMLTHPVQPDHLQVAVRYRPAASEHEVGGDWYDAFQQPDGASVLVIGDVVGHDIAAAAAMGQLRNLVRAMAFGRDDPPSRVLTRVDEAIRGLDVDTAATVLVGRIERPSGPTDATRRLLWSSAGHLPPLLLLRDGSGRPLATPPDLLLGIEPRTPRHDHTVELPEGSTVLLYTDGLVERRERSLLAGMAALQQNLSRLAGRELEDLCDDVLTATLPPAPGDDVAVLALRAHPEPERPVEQPQEESTA